MTNAGSDITKELCHRVESARLKREPLCIHGGNSKDFYGRVAAGTPLDVAQHCGIREYEPSELVITARCGTLLSDIETALDNKGQMLAFEPPHFGPTATLGGAIACGQSGPRRPYAGAARDFVLGTRIINGKGQDLSFGGQVMKNVAGYDVSRLMAGALGTLGVLLEISLKVLPKPVLEKTLTFECGQSHALKQCNDWVRRGLPLSGASFHQDTLYARMSGSESTVEETQRTLGGDWLDHSDYFWKQIREQEHSFFRRDKLLWRISVPANTPELALSGDWLIDWGGAQRWLYTDQTAQEVRDAAACVGGHASQFRGGKREEEIFHPLSGGVASMHRELKQAFDPDGILNPGRMYAEF